MLLNPDDCQTFDFTNDIIKNLRGDVSNEMYHKLLYDSAPCMSRERAGEGRGLVGNCNFLLK